MRLPFPIPARRLAAGLVAILLLSPWEAGAQAGGGSWGGRRPPGGEGGPRREGAPDRAPAREDAATSAFRELIRLDDELMLTEAQRPLFRRYADRVTALAADVSRAPRFERYEDAPVATQLDALADLARNRLTAVEDVVESGKALVAALDERQKAVAANRLARLVAPLLEGAPSGGPRPGTSGPPGRAASGSSP